MEGKNCTSCNIFKSLDAFHTKSKNFDGLEHQCKVCSNAKIRARRKNNSNVVTKTYEKTLKGKLVRTYRNMLSRVKGILRSKSHLYEGLEILDKEDFYKWSLEDPEYNRIFKEWSDAGHTLKLSPSIDRIDPTKGYILDNIRWLTHSQNSGAANHSR